MLKTFLTLTVIMLSQNALACSLVGGSAQYEKNIEDGIAIKRQQVEKLQKVGLEEENETVMALQKQLQDAKETQPISKYVNVEKYDIVYNNCVDELNKKSKAAPEPIAPCSDRYTVEECTHEAYERTKTE